MRLEELAQVKCQRCKRHIPFEDAKGILCKSCNLELKRIKFKQQTKKDYNKKKYG